MSAKNKSGSFSWLRPGRLICQIIALALVLFGYFSVVRSFGMPKWLFMLTIIVLGLFFCGWACPFGTVQEWLRAFSKKVLGITWKIPPRIDRYLLFSRYVFAAFGLLAIVSVLDSRRTFIRSLNGVYMGAAAVGILGVILLSSLFVERPYCKYLCGFGAVAGLASMLRVFGVRRSAAACVGCGQCDKACAMGVEVSRANNVRDPNCINCGKCVAACPVPGSLTVGLTPLCRADIAALSKKYRGSLGDTRVMIRSAK